MFNDLAITYLFLGGAGAGCSAVCSILILASISSASPLCIGAIRSSRGRPWLQLVPISLIVGCFCLVLGSFCLFADLGQPARVLMMLFPPKLSYLSLGAWSIIVCVLAAALVIHLWSSYPLSTYPRRHRTALRIGCTLLLASSLVVMLYTGLLLSSIDAVPLWDTVGLVALFCVSSLSCGIALITLMGIITGSLDRSLPILAKLINVDSVLLVIEALILLGIGIAAFATPFDPDVMTPTSLSLIGSWQELLFGSLSFPFWFCLVGIGIVLPFVLERIIMFIVRSHGSTAILALSAHSKQLMIVISAGGVLIGGLALRYMMVMAGMHPVLIPLL